LPEGSGVKILENGPKESIDGVNAAWVKVLLKDGRQGWCFGWYLARIPQAQEEVPRAAPAPPPKPKPEPELEVVNPDAEAKDGNAEENWFSSAYIVAVIIGGIQCGIVVIILKRKKKA
jgi:hypothetical protein